ncbi:MAG: hypothetical protein OES15_01840 [Nitrosopumilus sp.]|nr:hypothetical protein [Nitrosopumilus sp.]
MNVFGLEPIQATIIVTIIGVGLQVGLGYLKSGNAFDGRQLLTSAVITKGNLSYPDLVFTDCSQCHFNS